MTQKAVIYARTSLKTEKINHQIDGCTKFAEENNYEIVSVFMDEGYLANPDRPAFTSLLETLEEDRSLVVIVYHIDRLYKRDRDAFQAFQFKYHFRAVVGEPHI